VYRPWFAHHSVRPTILVRSALQSRFCSLFETACPPRYNCYIIT
jgi:hypothetical protein